MSMANVLYYLKFIRESPILIILTKLRKAASFSSCGFKQRYGHFTVMHLLAVK